MSERRKQIKYNVYAFLFLFFISLYRQISLKYLPNDPFRTYILYAGYVILIFTWAFSIGVRVTQKSMRNFLLLEAGVMLYGLTIRFLQDTFWYNNIRLMRISGLYIAATLLPMILLGLYASLGTGQADSYQMPKKLYGLLILVIALTFLIVEDERFHFVFFIDPEEPQPNLMFHPYTGTFLLSGFGCTLLVIRVLQIYRRNKVIHEQKLLRALIPGFEPIMLLLFSIDYFAMSLHILPGLPPWKEVIELYARYYYIEALMWEFYIYMGLVPVNNSYREIFKHATVDMQIIGDGGRLVSENATPVSGKILDELKSKDHVIVESGKELHMYALSDYYLLWNKDISLIQNTINELNSSAEALAQEGELLKEELKTKERESRLKVKNKIYDNLAREVADQLLLIKELTEKCSHQINDDRYLQQMYLLGTYVKRRCNLRLIQKETGSISVVDLRLSLENMVHALELMNIEAELHWGEKVQFSSGFSLYVFDMFENILECESFIIGRAVITAERDSICFRVQRSPDAAEMNICRINSKKYCSVLQSDAEGYTLKISEGGDIYVPEV